VRVLVGVIFSKAYVAESLAGDDHLGEPGRSRARGRERAVPRDVRTVAEAELFTEHALNASLGKPKPHSLWLRLEVAY
jgi:hypothetical protein